MSVDNSDGDSKNEERSEATMYYLFSLRVNARREVKAAENEEWSDELTYHEYIVASPLMVPHSQLTSTAKVWPLGYSTSAT